MTDFLLAKPILPPGFIDCSVGEAHVVREALYSIFDIDNYRMSSVPQMEYPFPTGYAPLVRLLEDKYQAPVVVCNGAKQALGASFYALHQLGYKTIGMRSPYWALIPPLMKMHGMEWAPNVDTCDSYLYVAPNNPDGWMMKPVYWNSMMETGVPYKTGIPIIHDGAYYTYTYLSPDYKLDLFGDVQIYSASKAFGLSGLRIGWAVCPNQDYYKLIQAYMETMTVGVSVLPQVFLYDLMSHMEQHPQMTRQFEKVSSAALTRSKQLIKQVNCNVLQVPDNIEETAGMFLWAKVGPKADFQKSKINVIDGKNFGQPGFIRMNLAFDETTMQDIVNRLNSVVV
jgi:aspartate/methionine/tyrosine aminotransferase